MKTIKLLSALALAATLLSFTIPLGGEHYSISINGTSVIEYFVYQKKPIDWLTLDTGKGGTISVLYNNCGHASKGRQLAVVNADNQVLKAWKFENVSSLAQSTMTIEMNEVTALVAKDNTQVSLRYTSDDLPQGRFLAHLKLAGETVAKKSSE